MKQRKKRIISKRIKTTRRPSFRIIVFLVTLALLSIIWFMGRDLLKVRHYGYLGILIVNFISNATVLLPLPGVVTVLWGGAIWNPVAVGIISGIGATLGEVFSYLVGYGGRGLTGQLEDKNHWLNRVEKLFHKTGFFAVLIFSSLPLPVFDIIGVVAGALNYPLWKFALATLVGRILRNIVIAWTGAKILPV